MTELDSTNTSQSFALSKEELIERIRADNMARKLFDFAELCLGSPDHINRLMNKIWSWVL